MQPLETMQKRELSAAVIFGAWLVAVCIAVGLDPIVARAVHSYAPPGGLGPLFKDGWLAHILKSPGDFRFTLVVAVLLTFLHPWKFRAAALLCLCAAVGGIFYSILKVLVGRFRPEFMLREPSAPDFHGAYDFGIRSFFNAPLGLSFPSGHTTLAFVTAAVLALCLPKYRWFFYAIAAVVGLERILEDTHYLSDVTFAAGLGVICRNLTLRLIRLFINEPDQSPTLANTPP
jgi:membrane-associated phospholipid phosphatase